MTSLFHSSEWRSLMTAITIAPAGDHGPRRAAAALLHSHGDRLRAAYIRACCPAPFEAGETVADSVAPPDFDLTPLGGWVPDGALLSYWHRGFIARVHGPLDAVRAVLPLLVLREPLYQSAGEAAVVSVSDHAPIRTDDVDGEQRWTWGCRTADAEETAVDGPMLPAELFDLLPWPPMFDSQSAASAALSAALLSEAHDHIPATD